MFNVVSRLAGAVVLFFAIAAPALADDCRLKQIASLDVEQSPYGLLVPADIDGTNKRMIIDTGSPLSIVTREAAAELHLVTHRVVQGTAYTSSGQQFTDLAEIRDLRIGNLRAENVRTLIYPSTLTRDGRIAGLLGANFLRHYEIELDLASNRLNLFEQDHCPGQVVYWKADAVAVVPIRIVQTGHIILPVTLDGQSMDALLDTGSTRTNLTEEAARQYFHLSPKSPGMNAVGESLYKRMFDKLDLDGLAIAHPTIFIREDRMSYGVKQSPQTGSRLSSAGESNGLTSLILGMSEMKRLRVFISYKEQKLYITPASTGAAAAATIDPSPSPAANTSK